jgi:hypothetical protein
MSLMGPTPSEFDLLGWRRQLLHSALDPSGGCLQQIDPVHILSDYGVAAQVRPWFW